MDKVKTFIYQAATHVPSLSDRHNSASPASKSAGMGWLLLGLLTQLHKQHLPIIVKMQQTSLTWQVLFKALDSRPQISSGQTQSQGVGEKKYLTSAMATKTDTTVAQW